MFNSNGYSLSDIAAASNNEGWGGGNSWWILILFILVFCGNGNWNNGGSTTREEIAYGFDNNQIQNGIRGLGNGICDSTYALNNAIVEGTFKTNNALTQGFAGLNSVINDVNNAQTISQMGNFNAIQQQLSQAASDNRLAVQDVKYTMATDTCAINTANSNNTRDIIDSQNCNTRAILEAIQQNKVDAMQDRIAELTAANQRLAFQASQAAQNEYIIDRLQPCPQPAYIVPNPCAAVQSCCCGCN